MVAKDEELKQDLILIDSCIHSLPSCFWVAISARYLLTDGEYLRTTDLWRGGNVRAVLEAGNNWLQPTR